MFDNIERIIRRIIIDKKEEIEYLFLIQIKDNIEKFAKHIK